MTQLSRHDNLLLPPPAAQPAALPAVPVRSTGKALLRDLAELAKLRITGMVGATAWLGYLIGQRESLRGFDAAGTAPTLTAPISLASSLPMWSAIIGASLSCMGAAALNQVYERDTDALMNRTRNRPMPSGRVAPVAGALFGVVLASLGIAILAAGANLLAAGLSAFTVLSYVFIYTPLKRVTHVSTIVGALPGALPPVIGYAAAAGQFGHGAYAICAIMFLWQLPHFLAIAWMYREDYGRAGFPMLPVLDPSGKTTFRQMLLGCLALLPVGLLPSVLRVCGPVYFVGALLAGLGFLGFAAALVWRPSHARAKGVFFASLVYLPVILILMAVDGA